MTKAYIYVFISALLFGTMEVSCKIGGTDLDSFQLTFLRFFVGGLFLLPFVVIQNKNKKIKLTITDFKKLAAVGILNVVISMSMFQYSVMTCNVSTVSVLICVNPFFTIVFAHFLTDEKITKEIIITLFIALTGILFMLRLWDVQNGNSLIGMLIMICSALTFGLYTVLCKELQKEIDPIAQNSISFLMGSLGLLIVILLTGRPVVAGVADNIPIVLYTGVMVTGLGYYCYFKAIELSDASTGSFAFFLKPAIAPVIAVIVLHEVIVWNTVVGIALILTASLLKYLGDRKKF